MGWEQKTRICQMAQFAQKRCVLSSLPCCTPAAPKGGLEGLRLQPAAQILGCALGWGTAGWPQGEDGCHWRNLQAGRIFPIFTVIILVGITVRRLSLSVLALHCKKVGRLLKLFIYCSKNLSAEGAVDAWGLRTAVGEARSWLGNCDDKLHLSRAADHSLLLQTCKELQ